MKSQKHAVTVIATIVAGVMAAALPSARGGMIDDRVYGDEFNGTALGSEWTTEVDAGSSITVSGGLVTVDSSAAIGGYASLWHANSVLAGLGASTDWWVEVRFKVTAALSTDPTRPWGLLTASDAPSTLNSVNGADFRLEADGSPGGATYKLGWYGYDNGDLTREPQEIYTGLSKDVFYTLTAHRKTDGNVDIYLDGSLFTNKPAINPGTNPSGFRMGESSGITKGAVVYDYVKAGGLPIPSSRIDDSIFFDDFDGNQVVPPGGAMPTNITTHWDGYVYTAGASITVTNSLCILTAPYTTLAFLYGKTASFAGLGSRTVWAAEVRFKVAPGFLGSDHAHRDFLLLAGVPSDTWVSSGMDFRLKKDGSGDGGATCSLAWWGYDGVSDDRVSEAIATLNKGAFYTLSAIRKGDGNVDISLNGSLIATKPVINPGVNPVRFDLGHSSSAGGGTVTYDYIKIGLPPPQGTVISIR